VDGHIKGLRTDVDQRSIGTWQTAGAPVKGVHLLPILMRVLAEVLEKQGALFLVHILQHGAHEGEAEHLHAH
jgi:hypothetical protein